MEALQIVFSWLATAHPAVQIVFLIVAGIVAVFALSDHSLARIPGKITSMLRRKK